MSHIQVTLTNRPGLKEAKPKDSDNNYYDQTLNFVDLDPVVKVNILHMLLSALSCNYSSFSLDKTKVQ